MKKSYLLVLALLIITAVPLVSLAHEAYVVPNDFFWQQMSAPLSYIAFGALENIHDVVVTLEITAGVLLALFLNFLFRRTKLGKRLHHWIEQFKNLGPIFVRVAIAAALFFGAQSNSFLGPELAITHMPFAEALRWGMYAVSAMVFFGVFTEIAALVGLIIFSIGFFAFGTYLVTYLNYLGELIVLFLFGMRTWSFDRLLFGPLKKWRHRLEPYETTIIRVCYGMALIFAAINVKILHADLTLRVINDWHLTQFHWLFPSDPLLILLGAGLAEAAIGLFIILGFEMRMTVFISLFYITLSLLFFRELVWPHILLYGISLNLIVQPEVFTIDHLLFKRGPGEKSIWHRLISTHRSVNNTTHH